MSDPITFTVLGAPRGKGRPRFVKATGRAYTDEETMRYSERVTNAAAAEMNGRALIETPVELHMRVIVDGPPGWPVSKRQKAYRGEIFPTTKPDLDNILKLISDALNKIVWVDDKQIVRGSFDKRYGPQPMLVVTVREINPALEALL